MDTHRPIGTVAAITRYPVKSLQGESLAEGAIVPAGDTATSFTMSFNVEDEDVDAFD